MIDFGYLHRGLCGLANAHKGSTLAGHLGAAVVAGYFYGEDRADLDEPVYRGVESELDRIIRGEEAFWFNSRKAGVTSAELFDPLPDERPDEEAIPKIAAALAGNVDQTRQSGHNVIFAAIALRALHDHSEYATPSIVGGVVKLIKGFDGVTAGRGYYGKTQGWKQGEQVELTEESDFPMYASEQQMVEVLVEELIRTAAIRKQGFGGLWHLVNHAAGLLELSRLGYEKLARDGLAAHHRHLRLYRSLPDVTSELGSPKRSVLSPEEPAYWTGNLKRDEARLTHRIKTMYGFNAIMTLIADDKTREAARTSFLYLMA